MPYADQERRRANARKYQKQPERLAYHREYYRRKRAENQEWLDAYKHSKGCSRCSERHPRCLDFHHVGSDKLHGVATLKTTKSAMLREMKKCELLCSNCHRKEHHGEYVPRKDYENVIPLVEPDQADYRKRLAA